MEYKFGEFDSVEELNEAAGGQLEEGDVESLIALAAENGIDIDDAQDYIDGCADVLATPLMAAYGKLDIEAKELQPYEIMEDWLQYIKVRCAEDEVMARAVRRKDKSLKGCIAEILIWSFKNAKDVDKDIMLLANIHATCKLGIPGIGRAKRIITDYYMK